MSAERKFSRKFVEGMLSQVVEKSTSKSKIMYAYLGIISNISFMLFDCFNYFSIMFFKIPINHASLMKIVSHLI